MKAISTEDQKAVLTVRDLRVRIGPERDHLMPVDGVSFQLFRGEALGIVGESGSGKSITLRSIVGLLPKSARVVGGEIDLGGSDLAAVDPSQLRKLRGTRISMIFQEPMTALNPTTRIGDQIAEGPIRRLGMRKRQARALALRLLETVGITDPARRARQYPHEFSGGMRQRVVIAIALACHPRIVLCDEPTTALDVTIQAQILRLLTERRLADDLSMVMVTHDLAVVAETCQRVVVMYAGKVVESGPVADLFAEPRHPYTLGLLRATPTLEGRPGRLASIPGSPPSLTAPPTGCRFADRCQFSTPECRETDPPLRDIGAGRQVACIHTEAVAADVSARPLVPGTTT